MRREPIDSCEAERSKVLHRELSGDRAEPRPGRQGKPADWPGVPGGHWPRSNRDSTAAAEDDLDSRTVTLGSRRSTSVAADVLGRGEAPPDPRAGRVTRASNLGAIQSGTSVCTRQVRAGARKVRENTSSRACSISWRRAGRKQTARGGRRDDIRVRDRGHGRWRENDASVGCSYSAAREGFCRSPADDHRTQDGPRHPPRWERGGVQVRSPGARLHGREQQCTATASYGAWPPFAAKFRYK